MWVDMRTAAGSTRRQEMRRDFQSCSTTRSGSTPASRNTTSPLIWPTLRKAFAFLVLLIILTIIEEAVVGLFHHRSIASSLSELVGPRLEETIAGFVIMLLVLIPFFAFRVLSEALREGRLERMFLVERERR